MFVACARWPQALISIMLELSQYIQIKHPRFLPMNPRTSFEMLSQISRGCMCFRPFAKEMVFIEYAELFNIITHHAAADAFIKLAQSFCVCPCVFSCPSFATGMWVIGVYPTTRSSRLSNCPRPLLEVSPLRPGTQCHLNIS